MSLEQNEKVKNYVTKLMQALDLLYNDLPDHQDDTIMVKAIDIIRDELRNERDRNQQQQEQASVSSTLRSYLLTEIIESPAFKASLVNKDFEIVQIFFDFIGAYVEVYARSDTEFASKTVEFLSIYLKDHLETHFIAFPTVTCAVLNLITLIFDEVNLAESNQLPANTSTVFNDTILERYMFSASFLQTMLKANCKSVFVRKAFKQLVKKQLAYLIRKKLSNCDKVDKKKENKLSALICNLSKNMPLEIRMHNTDIISDTLELFLFDTESDACSGSKGEYLFEFYSSFQFDELELHELLDCGYLINDASIESLTTILAFRMLSKMKTTGVEQNVKECFLPQINKICCYFSNYKAQSNNNSSEKHLFIQFKKSSDLLFKFLSYLYSFLNKLIAIRSRLSNNIGSVQSQILNLFMAPLTMNLNSDTQNSSDESYLSYIVNDKFKYKQMLVKQCLSNMRVFIRKFHVDLFDNVSAEQIVYILRNLSVDLDVKNLLLTNLVECLKQREASSQASDNLKDLFIVLLESLHLKINDSFNENLFKIITIYMTKLAEEKNEELLNATTRVIIEKLFGHLQSSAANTDKPLYFSEQLEILLNFLTNLLKTSQMNVGAINQILSHNGCYILKTSSAYVTAFSETTSPVPNSDTLAELQDTSYQFYAALFDSLRNHSCTKEIGYVSEIFSIDFISKIQELSRCETEAFIRRESVKFQAKYHLFKLEQHLSSPSPTSEEYLMSYLLTTCNHFSTILVHDFDWQVQMSCIDFFQDLLKIIVTNMDKCGYKRLLLNLSTNQHDQHEPTIIETVCFGSNFLASILYGLDDYDQHVVNLTARFLFDLNKYDKFINLLEEFNKKNEPFWTSYFNNVLNTKLKVSLDYNENLSRFLALRMSDRLPRLIEESSQTTDLYVVSPESILDDIISSYKFDLEDEKHIDCY